MNRIRAIVFIDIMIMLLLPVVMCESLLGRLTCMCAGFLLAVLFIIQQFLSYNITFPKDKNLTRYKVLFIMNCIIFACALIYFTSSILLHLNYHPQSGAILSLQMIKMLRYFAACWGFCLIGIRIGYNIQFIVSTVVKYGRNYELLVHLVLGIVSLYGVYSFIKNHFIDYMFLRNVGRLAYMGNPLTVLIQYMSIMVMFIFLTHHILKLLDESHQQKVDKSEN